MATNTNSSSSSQHARATLLDEILSPSKGPRRVLYGRDEEQEQMKTIYRRVLQNNQGADGNDNHDKNGTTTSTTPRTNELILVSGPSGVGKTALAQSLQRQVEDDGGFFVTGKFSQMQRPEPHAAFCEALTQFVHLIVRQRPHQPQDGPQRLRTAMIQEGLDLETDGKILIGIAPALEEIIASGHGNDTSGDDTTTTTTTKAALSSGPPPPPGPLGQHDTTSSFAADSSAAALRFKYVCRSFVRAALRTFRPVVCLLEDLHWADETSLDLIQFLAEDSEQPPGALYIGTFRNDEQSLARKNLVAMVQNLNATKVNRTEMEVCVLTVDDVGRLLESVLLIDNVEATELATIIHNRTNGNIFFVWEVLKSLVQRKLLHFDIDHYECNHEEVGKELNQVGGVQELVVSKIFEFPKHSIESLKIAACLGATLDPAILQYFTSEPVLEFLQDMSSRGFFRYDDTRKCWSFSHDVVQEATYQRLIPVNERIGYHYRIGRKLWRVLDEEKLNDFIFLVVSQLVTAVGCLKDEEEKVAIAYLCLSAGVKGVSLSNFRTALFFFENGIALLGPKAWKTQYRLCLALHNSAAEVATSIGLFEKNLDHVNQVISNAETFNDSLRAYAAKVHALGSRGDFHDALQQGVAVLQKLDVDISTNPSKMKITMNWLRTRWRLRRRSVESLMRLPEMNDPQKLGAMQMLNLIFLYAVHIKPDLSPLIGLKMLEMTLDHGISAVSCVGFAIYGYALGTVERDPDNAYRYGQLAFALYEKYGAKAFLPRLSAIFYEGVHSWKRPAHEMFAPLQSAHRVGMETGDIEFATMCAAVPTWTKYEYQSLVHLHKELASLRERMVMYRQVSFDLVTRPIHQSVLNMIGLSADKAEPTILRGEAYSEEVERKIENDNMTMVRDWSVCHEMILCCLFGEYQRAYDRAPLCRNLLHRHSGPMGASIAIFYSGFAYVAYARQQKEERGKRIWFAARRARKLSRELKRWSVHGPHNFLGKHLLLEAELAALSGHKSAHPKYIAAIGALREGRLLAQLALAHERLAFYLHNQAMDPDGAKAYFLEALALFRKWGASAKVERFAVTLRRLGLEESAIQASSGAI